MEERKLYRSRDDRMIAGVAGGIADYFDIDPSLVRLLAVVVAVVGNVAAVIAYIVMWIVVPEAPLAQGAADSATPPPTVNQDTGQSVAQPIAQPSARPTAVSPAQPPVPPTPPKTPAPPIPDQPPTPPQVSAGDGVRAGAIWFGLLLIMVGSALFAEELVPDLDLWGFWPATLGGLVLIAIGIRQMVTPGSDDR